MVKSKFLKILEKSYNIVSFNVLGSILCKALKLHLCCVPLVAMSGLELPVLSMSL